MWKKTLEAAHQALRTAVDGVPGNGWQLPTPCEQWNVTQVLQHAAGDQLGFAAFLTGGDGPTEDPFAPSGDLDGRDPRQVVEAAIEAAAKAWATVDDNATEVPVPVPPNRLPVAIGAGACALDAAVHAWDIAIATGQPSPLSDELARDLRPTAEAIVEPLRAYGAYAPALNSENGGEAAELLRYLGRRPR
ncbi:TIGR03086 family metal-binding protein [Amycolatopsis sp. YIM 10]|uniref:TIGR03086 family metal-binding protein n=1 Tax=Amycolatopsis sp. YIM 10 TaxID=2653857 RepID=UPI00128FD013|nr:TIGR03086 family metal-binding protein [Amycolatopsis sp. YIM 10]QFU94374.1 hypothetical protein YIM_46240 [Amycolatopsis sp. YIM 10]